VPTVPSAPPRQNALLVSHHRPRPKRKRTKPRISTPRKPHTIHIITNVVIVKPMIECNGNSGEWSPTSCEMSKASKNPTESVQ